MKICPKCKRSYNDDTLRFCLDDGSVLAHDPTVTLPYQSATLIAAPRTPVVSEKIPRQRPGAIPATPVPENIVRATPTSSPILTAGVILIAGLLLILTVVGVAFVYSYWKTSESAALPASSPTPTPTRQIGSADPGRPAAGALQIKASASSVRYAVQSNTYDPINAIDNSKRTAWIEGVDGPGIGEWLRFDFGREINLHRLIILPGYFKSAQIWAQNNRLASATLEFSDGSSNHFTFPDRMERQTLDVGAIKTRWVRLVIDGVFSGTDPDTAVSEVTFEWEP